MFLVSRYLVGSSTAVDSAALAASVYGHHQDPMMKSAYVQFPFVSQKESTISGIGTSSVTFT